MATVQPQTTQLEFYQAMADFKTMFPLMDDDVIEAVLRSNEGAVDATIDQLLAMSTDNENEKIRHELELKDEPPQSDDADVSDRPSSDEPLRTVKGWDGASILVGTLPDDFLRLPLDIPQVFDDRKSFQKDWLKQQIGIYYSCDCTVGCFYYTEKTGTYFNATSHGRNMEKIKVKRYMACPTLYRAMLNMNIQ